METNGVTVGASQEEIKDMITKQSDLVRALKSKKVDPAEVSSIYFPS